MAANPRSIWRTFLGLPQVWIALSILLVFLSLAIFGPLLCEFQPGEGDFTERLQAPSPQHWLGTDLDGIDLFTSMVYGARVSLYIAALTVLLSALVGITCGLISGYFLGWVDSLLMRFVDIVMAVPGILVAMVLSSLLGQSAGNIIFAIAATGWTSSARLVRGQVLSIREREYVSASRLLGASNPRVLWKHIFPMTWTPLVVHSTFSLSGIIIVEASLSFLGLGAQDGAPTWGALLSQGRVVLEEAPYLSIAPGLAIMAVVLSLNFLGDALRDTLDPKHAKRD